MAQKDPIHVDLSAPMDFEWVPAFDDLPGDPELVVLAPVRCGAPKSSNGKSCNRKVDLEVVQVRGLRLVIGSRRLAPTLIEPESRRRVSDGGDERSRNWLGPVAIPLEGDPGGPVVLTPTIREAVSSPERLSRWDSWLRTVDEPAWTRHLFTDCGIHSTVLLIEEVLPAIERNRQPATHPLEAAE